MKEGVLHKYRDFAIQHLIELAKTDADLDIICEKSVFRLLDYDRKHHTDLARTLDIYIRNERSLILTSNELHIHRNTLVYRIARITDLLGINLSDRIIRERIFLSFRILEKEGHTD